MAWDPLILRKFSTTGHFRLLNQLRSELQAHPLERQVETDPAAGAGRGKAVIRTVAVRRGGQSQGRIRRPQARMDSGGASLASADAGQSFRDRLNAIEMR
ncbi:hypothetical protein KQ310_14340 [Synechococcus sp. CS-1328]|nr:hypothetical protein [Synechococcus sp. CS-1328]